MSANYLSNVCQYFPPSDDTDKAVTGDHLTEPTGDVEPLLVKAVQRMDDLISIVKNRLFAPLMDSLFEFVRQNSLTNQMREKRFETKFTANTGLIPTALLSLGIPS